MKSSNSSPHAVLWIGLAASFAIGILSALILPGDESIFPAVVIACVATIWCRLDAIQHKQRWTTLQTLFTFFLYPIVVPVYLLQSNRSHTFTAIAVAVSYGIIAWALVVLGYVAAN